MTDISVTQLGFVIIGRNEGNRLQSCLQSVLQISSNVVYADSASSDGSAELAERMGAIVVRLPDDGFLTAARGRNAGYNALRSRFTECQFVQFLDGDCILQPGWIEQALGFLREHPDIAIVCGRRFEADPGGSMFNAMCDSEWNTPVGQAEECGGDALVRCDAFDQVGGYHSHLQAGEEPEMSARMRAAGWKIWRIDGLMAEHDARMHTLRQWWRRTQRGGFGFAQVWYCTRNLPHPLYGRQLRSAFFWAVALPMLVASIAILVRQPVILLAIPALYCAQVIRIGSRNANKGRWTNAGLLLLAKLPETIGACRFLLAREAGRVPEYKS